MLLRSLEPPLVEGLELIFSVAVANVELLNQGGTLLGRESLGLLLDGTQGKLEVLICVI